MFLQTSSHSSSLHEPKRAPEQRDMFRPYKVSSDVHTGWWMGGGGWTSTHNHALNDPKDPPTRVTVRIKRKSTCKNSISLIMKITIITKLVVIKWQCFTENNIYSIGSFVKRKMFLYRTVRFSGVYFFLIRPVYICEHCLQTWQYLFK